MADVDRRVRLLTDLLADSGFAWLAAEIFSSIEAGHENPEDQDYLVAEQRRNLEEGLAKSRTTFEGQYDGLDNPSASSPRSFDPDTQVRIAVELVIQRLAGSADMMSESVSKLSSIAGEQVGLFVEVDGSTRSIDTVAASQAAGSLRARQNELIRWLISPPVEGAT